jgi:hypothetical protein
MFRNDFSPLEKEIYLGPVFFLVIARPVKRQTPMTDLIRRAYDTRQFFFADLNIFYIHPRQNRDFGRLGCRDSFFFLETKKLDQSQIVTKVFTQLRLNAK